MSPRVPPTGGADPPAEPGGSADVTPEHRARAAEALQAAFTRLSPQGSDAWYFLAAFTQLGDRYGPYHPGASELSDAVAAAQADAASAAQADAASAAAREDVRRTGVRRLRPRRRAPEPEPEPEPAEDPSELSEAMAQVVEAFRFLSARVQTLEERMAAEDRPVDGAAWLVPARDLGSMAGPVADHVLVSSPGGMIVHADCGRGDLLHALRQRGVESHGVEPRGLIALRAIEDGCSVTIAEVSEHLATLPEGSVGGLVLSGVADRLPLYGLLPLLSRSRHVLRRGAPLVVVSEAVTSLDARGAPARDLVAGRPLHDATWEVVLQRVGFAEVAPLPEGADADGRTVVSALSPR